MSDNDKRALYADLLQRNRPLLGLAEPTITGQGTRRLHETHPHASRQSIANILWPADIVATRMDWSVGQSTQEKLLPGLVQYDLFHLVEALPNSRRAAAEDQLHSFFYSGIAFGTTLQHVRYWHERGAKVMLMWHTFNPLWGKQDFNAITQADSERNPFGMLHNSTVWPRERQQTLFQSIIQDLNTPAITNQWLDHFRAKLDRIVAFAGVLAEEGISAIFRPYHEHTPEYFFWWATENLADDPIVGAEWYQQLYRNTITYLKERGVNNFLYAYSPDTHYQKTYASKENFLTQYRRGLSLEVVDILGLDAYLWKQVVAEDQLALAQVSTRAASPEHEVEQLAILARSWERILQLCTWLREAYPDKIVGLTETGWDYSKWGNLDQEVITKFWQTVGVDRLRSLPVKDQPHFICFWRNDSAGAFHPYPGVCSAFDQEIAALSNSLETVVWDEKAEDFSV